MIIFNLLNDERYRMLGALTLISFLSSIQFWLVIACWAWATPPSNTLAQVVYPEWWKMLNPEREGHVFHGIVLTAVFIQVGLWVHFRHQSKSGEFIQRLTALMVIDLLCTVLMLAAVFQMVVYAPRGQLSKFALGVLVGLAIIYKLGWAWCYPWARQGFEYLKKFNAQGSLARMSGISVVALIGLLLYIPHPQAVVARMYMGEQFHHFDSALASPAIAFLNGARLNVDVFSQYGVGIPIVVGMLTKAMGGFSYTSALVVLVIGTIIYFTVWFFCLRRWVKDSWLSLLMVIVGITTQMFHAGAYPIVFTYPSTTVWRFLGDAFFFWMVITYIEDRRLWRLVVAGLIGGAACFMMTTTGLCLVLTLIAFIGADGVLRFRQGDVLPWRMYALAMGAVGAAVVALLVIFIGPGAFTHEFWRNMNEFNVYFMSGFGVEPMDGPLRQHHLFAGTLGFMIPCVYLIVILIQSSRLLFGCIANDGHIAWAVACYGLLLFHYYVSRSVSANIFVVALPAVFLVGYFLVRCNTWVPVERRVFLKGGLIVLTAFMLITNHQFIAYPNILNVSPKPMVDPLVAAPLPDGRPYFNHIYSQLPEDSRLPLNSLGETEEHIKTETDFNNDEALVAHYHAGTDFTKDVTLINQLLDAREKLPLISSFEVEFFRQSHRQPFFYHASPLVVSRLLSMRILGTIQIYTKAQLELTIGQVEKDKPDYIFIEKVFNADNIAVATYNEASAFLPLMKYVHAHYAPHANGKYLMALKRREGG